MGQRGRRKGTVSWTAESIQERLNRFLENPRYVLRNLYVFGWESDLLFLTLHGYYWSSSEYSNYDGLVVDFSSGDCFNNSKNSRSRVRLVRDF